MKLNNYLHISDKQAGHLEDVYTRYRMLYEKPDSCLPMFIIDTPVKTPAFKEQLADPLIMLKAQLEEIKSHLETGDDRAPTVRVNFGTPQVAAAFGCEIFTPENSLPAAGSFPLKKAEDVHKLKMPSLGAGAFGKLKEWTDIWLVNLPDGVFIQHPDIQSAFNTAHLVRGNGILTDFFDDPDALCCLLDLVTDYMIKLVPHLRKQITSDPDWFFDWFSLWKGAAGIRNCSATMISPEFYKDYVLPHDIRFLKAIGGGRMHYCGTSKDVIKEFFKIPYLTGFDYDAEFHDPWFVSGLAPKNVPIFHWDINGTDKNINRLMEGDWPDKRNIIVRLHAGSIEEGRHKLKRLRESAARFYL